MRMNFLPESPPNDGKADLAEGPQLNPDDKIEKLVRERVWKARVFESGSDELMSHRVLRYQKI